jgi:hypothetical protein
MINLSVDFLIILKNVVGIATSYGLEGPRFEFWLGARFFSLIQTDPDAHPASCALGTGFLSPGVKQTHGADHPPLFKYQGRECVDLYLHLPFVPALACYEMTFTFTSQMNSINILCSVQFK